MNTTELKVNKEKAESLFKSCSPIFLALGDYIRQKLILDIAASDNDGVNISYLTERTSLSRPAVAYHLKMLKDAGLIRTAKKGAQVYYYLNLEEKIIAISDFVNLLQHLIIEKKQVQPQRTVF